MAILGTLVLTVLVQVVVLFGQVHRSTLAASAAARELGRVVVLADDQDDAQARGAAAVAQAALDHGLASDALHPRIEGVVARGAELRVIVTTEVPVLGIPGLSIPGLRIPVRAEHVVVVDRYRSFEP
jgi:hypothetical protein